MCVYNYVSLTIRELQETTHKAVTRASEADTRLSTMQAGEEETTYLSYQSSLPVVITPPTPTPPPHTHTALESTQSEIFELKNKFDEESSARLVHCCTV